MTDSKSASRFDATLREHCSNLDLCYNVLQGGCLRVLLTNEGCRETEERCSHPSITVLQDSYSVWELTLF